MTNGLPDGLKITKNRLYVDSDCLVKVDYDALDMPTPTRPWAGPKKYDRQVTQVYADTPYFRAYAWKSKNGHEFVRVAVPTDAPHRVRTFTVDDPTPGARQGLVAEVRSRVEASLTDH